MVKTPWFWPMSTPPRVEVRTVRFPGRDNPRAVVAVASPFLTGYRFVHLTRPVAYNARQGPPAWLYRAAVEVRLEALRPGVTLAELAEVAKAAHAGRGVPPSYRGR